MLIILLALTVFYSIAITVLYLQYNFITMTFFFSFKKAPTFRIKEPNFTNMGLCGLLRYVNFLTWSGENINSVILFETCV